MHKKYFKVTIVLILTCIYLISGCMKENKSIQDERTLKYRKSSKYVPVFCQFFDWFNEKTWIEEEFVDPFLWEEIGIYDEDRSTEEFYRKQFEYIKKIGIDALAWEFHPRLG